jgi:hypothetical protein
MRTSPDGVTGVDTSAAYCSSFVPAPPLACLGGGVFDMVPTGGASYALIQGSTVYRLVLRH